MQLDVAPAWPHGGSRYFQVAVGWAWLDTARLAGVEAGRPLREKEYVLLKGRDHGRCGKETLCDEGVMKALTSEAEEYL